MYKEPKEKLDVMGEIYGVDFRKRGEGDNHVTLELYFEDDGYWHKSDSISSFWIDDMIKVLQEVKAKLDSDFEKEDWGYQFK